MYAFVEEPSRTHCDSSVQSLSWMGKAPDGQPESGTAWRLSENSYYDEGWLASGNSRGVVGVTMTGCRSTQNSSVDLPLRTNFNLRGHRSEVGITIALNLIFMPPGAGNIVFMTCLCMSVHLLFPRYPWCSLMAVHQTFVNGTSWNSDELFRCWGQKVKVQGHCMTWYA